MSSELENSLCQAIDILVSNAVDNAGYDRTIRATVLKCVDESIGKYSCKYQDTTFYAFGDPEFLFPEKTEVYVSIPNNDFSNSNKRIIDTVKKLGTDYIAGTDSENFYDKNGLDCIEQGSGPWQLKSYDYGANIELYKKGSKNEIGLNEKNTYQYLGDSSSVIIKMNVRTALPSEQQLLGNYGLRIVARVKSDANSQPVDQVWLLDVDRMVGNPYKLQVATEQKAIYPITKGSFIDIYSITLFADFPINKNSQPYDLFFSDIQLYGANRVTEAEANGYNISFLTPNGTFFNDPADKPKKIQAQVKLKGKVVDATAQKLEFYWFQDDMRISSASPGYHKLGGIGWRCLNPSNIIEGTEGKPQVVEWTPMGDSISVNYNQALAKENKFKCVVKSGTSTFFKVCVIKNLSPNNINELVIKSSQGTIFDSGVGSPNLTCFVNDKHPEGYTYCWGKQSASGYMELLPDTTELNKRLKEKKEQLDTLLDKIDKGEIFIEDQQSVIDSLEKDIQADESLQRIDGYNLYSLDLSQVSGNAIFKCSVYNNYDVYCGTADITIVNGSNGIKDYLLVINNGDQIFKYDNNGVSPTSSSNERPQTVNALTFSLFDEEGNEIKEDVLKTCDIRWKVPIKDTMITSFGGGQNSVPTEDQKYQYVKNAMILTFDVATRYNRKNDKNDIELSIKYKNGVTYNATTKFTFLKEGELGTSGSGFTCKLQTRSANSSIIPMFTFGATGSAGNLNFIPEGDNANTISDLIKRRPYDVVLYKDGTQIYKGNSTGQSSEKKLVTITWKFLGNKYSNTSSDYSFYMLNTSTGEISVDWSRLDNFRKLPFANLNTIGAPGNLLQCTVLYDGLTLYDVAPIVTGINYNSDAGGIKLVDKSGYISAMYTSDGRTPKYDDDLFEVRTYNKDQKDVSTIKGANAVNWHWQTIGTINVKNKNEYVSQNTNLLTITPSIVTEGEGEDKVTTVLNTATVKPKDQYDGQCVTNAIVVEALRGTTNFTRIHIPIHLYLNKFGLSAVNQWDGNSVQLDKDGGFILSPQIGAGSKNEKNEFSGVLMGKVKESERTSEDTGLLGYHNGQKTFFLDSDDGSLTLGKQGEGRIVIDPTQAKALLYSSSYWKNYDEKGKPKSYTSASNLNGQGMLIDLSTPEIKFGNGNFSVNSDGHLIAKGGGSIAGWNISDTALSKTTETVDVGMGSKPGEGNKAFWAKTKKTSPSAQEGEFSVTHDGYLTSSAGTIGGWQIGKQTISSVGTHGKDPQMQLWNDGTIQASNGKFIVDKNGNLTSTSGTIGGWTIGSRSLQSKADGNGGKMQLYTDGSIKASNGKFEVDRQGNLTATSGKIGGWTIGANTLSSNNGMSFNGNTGTISAGNGTFSVSNTGYMTATSGKIGGWRIGATSLVSNNDNMKINYDGSMSGPGWSINAAGYAKFTNLNGTVGSGGISSDGGFKVGGNGKSVGLPGGSSTTVGGNKTLTEYVEDLVVGKLKAEHVQIGINGGSGTLICYGSYVSLIPKGAINIKCPSIQLNPGANGTLSVDGAIGVKYYKTDSNTKSLTFRHGLLTGYTVEQ